MGNKLFLVMVVSACAFGQSALADDRLADPGFEPEIDPSLAGCQTIRLSGTVDIKDNSVAQRDCVVVAPNTIINLAEGKALHIIAKRRLTWGDGVRVSGVGRTGTPGTKAKLEVMHWTSNDGDDENKHRKFVEAKASGCPATDGDLIGGHPQDGQSGGTLRIVAASVVAPKSFAIDIHGGDAGANQSGRKYCYCKTHCAGVATGCKDGELTGGSQAQPVGGLAQPGTAEVFARIGGANAPLVTDALRQVVGNRNVVQNVAIGTAASIVKDAADLAARSKGFKKIP